MVAEQDIGIVEELEDIQDAGVKTFLLGICKVRVLIFHYFGFL